jgi:membrane protease YdiL (CAAX protease family)
VRSHHRERHLPHPTDDLEDDDTTEEVLRPDRRGWIAPAFALAYVALSLGTVIVEIGLLTALLVGPATAGALPEETSELASLLGARAIAAITAVQFAGMFAVAVALAGLLPTRAELRGRPRNLRARLVDAFPIDKVGPRRFLAAALVLGCTAGLLPSWITEQISEATGMQEAAAQIVGLIVEAGPLDRALVLGVVVVLGPLVEELVFRGFLFAAFDRSLSRPWVVLATALLFAAYHLDPLQSLAVLPLGLVLGWLRSATGGIWAGLTLHVVNNALASVLILFTGDEGLSLAATLGGTAVAVAAIAVTTFTAPRAPESAR